MLLQILIHFPVLVAAAETTAAQGDQQIDYWVEFKDWKKIDEELGIADLRTIGILADHPLNREDIVEFLNNYEPDLELYMWGKAEPYDEF